MEATHDCAICGDPVDDAEVIAVRHASGTMAHDWHGAAEVRVARLEAGADPDTADDLPAMTDDERRALVVAEAHEDHGGASGSFWPDCELCPPDEHRCEPGGPVCAVCDLDSQPAHPFDEQPGAPAGPTVADEWAANPIIAANDLTMLERVDELLRRRAGQLDADADAALATDPAAERTLRESSRRYIATADGLAGLIALARCRA